MSDGLKAAQERTSDVLPVAETPSPHVVIRDVAEQKRIEEAVQVLWG